jgi:hypothetical protein
LNRIDLQSMSDSLLIPGFRDSTPEFRRLTLPQLRNRILGERTESLNEPVAGPERSLERLAS